MRKNYLRTSLYLVICLLLTAGFTKAQVATDVVRPFIGFNGTGSRAAGLGNAFSGVADDFSALYFNPAGLANITWAEATIGGTYNIFKNDIKTIGTETRNSSVSRNYFHTNSAAYIWPAAGMKFTLGLGYHSVSILDRAFDISGVSSYNAGGRLTDVNFSSQSNEESGLGAYSIGIGYQLQKELSFGLSLDLYSGKSTYNANQSYNYVRFDSAFVYKYKIDDSYSGMGVKFGVLLAPTDFWRTGISFSTPKYLAVNETYTDLLDNWSPDYNYHYQSPPDIRLGQSINVGNLLVTGSIVWKDWSLTRFDSNQPDSIVVPINNNLRDNFASILEYGGGVELLLPFVNAKVRGGFHYIPSYLKNSSLSARKIYSIGASAVLAQQFKVDFAYSLDKHTENHQDYLGQYDGPNKVQMKSDITNSIVSLNFSYRF